MDLTMATKRQIIERQKNPYRRASKKEKSRILGALVTTTGLTRDHVSRILRDQYQYKKGPIKPGRGRKPVYGMAHKDLLKEAWILLQFPSSRRLEGQEAVETLNHYYGLLSVLNNFFLPSQKLIKRVRDGSKVIRKHDLAIAPCRHLLIEETLSFEQKEELHEFFESLDLISIQKEMGKLLAQLQSRSLGY